MTSIPNDCDDDDDENIEICNVFSCFFLLSAREKECDGDDGEQARANRAATYISLALVGALAVCLPRFFEVSLHILPEIIQT